jgi:hypothetical protein
MSGISPQQKKDPQKEREREKRNKEKGAMIEKQKG